MLIFDCGKLFLFGRVSTTARVLGILVMCFMVGFAQSECLTYNKTFTVCYSNDYQNGFLFKSCTRQKCIKRQNYRDLDNKRHCSKTKLIRYNQNKCLAKLCPQGQADSLGDCVEGIQNMIDFKQRQQQKIKIKQKQKKQSVVSVQVFVFVVIAGIIFLIILKRYIDKDYKEFCERNNLNKLDFKSTKSSSKCSSKKKEMTCCQIIRNILIILAFFVFNDIFVVIFGLLTIYVFYLIVKSLYSDFFGSQSSDKNKTKNKKQDDFPQKKAPQNKTKELIQPKNKKLQN